MSLRRYTSIDEDSARWNGFRFRDDDIVVSTRSKHGTTWVQMILLPLIHQRAPLPAPLAQLSPWLDHLVEPQQDVIAPFARDDPAVELGCSTKTRSLATTNELPPSHPRPCSTGYIADST